MCSSIIILLTVFLYAALRQYVVGRCTPILLSMRTDTQGSEVVMAMFSLLACVRRLRWPLWTRKVVQHHATDTSTHSCTAIRLDTSDLGQLRAKMKAGPPTASALCNSLRNVIEGRVEGHFYTDGWPEFTTVVFQCLQPRLSDVCDLHCYTTSKQQLHWVLEQARLVTSGQWQYIQIVEDDDAVVDYVVQNIRPNGQTRLSRGDYAVHDNGMYALVGQLPTTSAECPEGYRLGELAAEHSTLVSSQAGMWITSFGQEKFMKECIQNLQSAAVFCDSDPTTPVAWCMQFGVSGEVGNLYTLEEYRRKGLGTAVKRAFCRKLLSQGDIPFSVVLDGAPTSSVKWQSKAAFQHVGRMKELILF